MDTLLLDFDGVFNLYEGYVPDELPEIRPGIEEFLIDLKEQGFELVVFTARTPLEDVREWLLEKNLMQYIEDVTNIKIPAKLYIDDNALTFEGDFESTLNEVRGFKPYWASRRLRELSDSLK